MSRLFGAFITILWFACMGLLISRDVAPYWQAQQPPSGQIPDGAYQVSITNSAGRRVGTTWITTIHMSQNVAVHSTTRLDVGEMSSFLPLAGELFLDTDLSYPDGVSLDDFSFHIETPAMSAHVKGTRYGDEFACVAMVGPIKQSLAIDARLSKYLGDAMRPFTHLEGLQVGQSWRLQLIDPFALLTSGSIKFTTQLVKVVGRETIRHRDKDVSCFRIDTDGTSAWADDQGRVLRQEITIPVLGKWIMEEEPFQEETRVDAKRRLRSLQEARHKASNARLIDMAP